MGRTIAEKILSNHSGKNLRANDIAICDVDFCFGQDGTSSLIIESFKRLGISDVFDKLKFAMFLDHSSPSPNIGTSTIHKIMRDFAHEKNLKLFEIGDGVCHQLVPEYGFVSCGDLILGADSHTCTYGALNTLASGVGSTDLAITLASGKNWFKVPETIKIAISGKLPIGVYSKDIILSIIRDVGSNGATYKSLEFCGDTLKKLSIEARLTITNMSVEMGAKCGIMYPDSKVLSWIRDHSKRKPNPVVSDEDARFADVREYEIGALSPQIAKPHTVDNVVSIEEIENVKINQGFIGTCTNGRTEDLGIAAKILKGKVIHPEVRLVIAPASRGTYLEAIKKGFIKIFVDSGAMVVSPGCGPCVGTHNGVPADGENVISTANRNFKGRMGNPNANIYLASPATVAASCIEGKIADPRTHKRRL